jgi:predicted RNA binding protein YcfA (HicA-like mRNA interferase family)
MKSVSGKRLCKILEINGWQLKKINGSHHIYMKHGKKERISIPVHANKDIKLVILMSIIKIAEIDTNEL